MSQSSKEAGGESPRSALLSILAQTTTEFSIAHVSGYHLRHAQEELNGLLHSLKDSTEILEDEVEYISSINIDPPWILNEMRDRIKKNREILQRLTQ